ncbi:ArgE/DapE family deacylase [Brevibacterium samyangense]|uniref:ArgE/DapE family deacylase n=1 Tax=Brevibacterium samyangense TaxID=366888 RepID=A0ABN2TEF7_9MICO
MSYIVPEALHTSAPVPAPEPKLTEEQRQAILAAVEANWEKQVALTQELVAIPSLRNEEGAVQERLAAAFAERGLEVDSWHMNPDELAAHPGAGSTDRDYEQALVVVGTHTPSVPEADQGPSLILNGHIDVVPVGAPEQWERDPFEPAIVDGWLHGRGSGDMKAGLVGLLSAYDAIRAAGMEPAGRIHIESVPEEESTGHGTLATILRGYLADAVLIGEPTDGAIERAQIGLMWVKIRLTGKAAHASIMKEGFNAIDAAYAMIGDLRKLEDEWNIKAKENPLYAPIAHPINFNVGTIRGGDWPSSVPDWCEMVVRTAVPVGMDVADGWEEIQERVHRAVLENPGLEGATATVERVGYFSNPHEVPEGSAQEALLDEMVQYATGDRPKKAALTGYMDARLFGEYHDIPTLVYGPEVEGLHAPAEKVNLASVLECTKTTALFIAEWCGVVPKAE